MSYKTGDIVLVRFPFTNLKNLKKRPVLIIKDENNLGDIVCFQVTSKSTQTNLLKIKHLSAIDKKIAEIDINLLSKLKLLFCETIF